MKRLMLWLAIGLLAPADALASAQGVLAVKKWNMMDKCARDAQAAFPDFTAEANAKRDAKLKECLDGQGLPPREPLAPAR